MKLLVSSTEYPKKQPKRRAWPPVDGSPSAPTISIPAPKRIRTRYPTETDPEKPYIIVGLIDGFMLGIDDDHDVTFEGDIDEIRTLNGALAFTSASAHACTRPFTGCLAGCRR